MKKKKALRVVMWISREARVHSWRRMRKSAVLIPVIFVRALSVMKTRWSSPLPLRVTLCSSAKSPATFACSKSRRVPIGKLFSKKNKPRSSLTLPLTTL